MKKRLLAALLACILCFALLPQVALAANTIELDKLTTDQSGSGWSFSGGVLTITDGGTYTISGTTTTTTTNRIEVKATDPVTITLKDVNIDVSNIDDVAALRLYPGANVKLLLKGTSELRSGGRCAGIQAPAGTKLTIEGSGTLEAFGGTGGAGIGGSWWNNGGEITIEGSAEVNAFGGEFAAGIGGGYGGGGGTITIAGSAIVNATGGGGGAGIGGGDQGNGGSITIAGSAIVNATGDGGGAGIGGGDDGDGGTIKITGSADVKAYGGELGAGIGGGNLGNGGTIAITGSANVTAQGGYGGAGIGGGDGYGGGEITIADSATVRAFGGDYGAGIGGGNAGDGGTIIIAGSANVTAQGGEGAAGIGGGNEGNGEEITIQPGARVAATGGNGEYRSSSGASGGGAGIGGGGGWGNYPRPEEMQGGKPGNISLPEGRRGVTAKGGTGGAGGNIKAGNGADIGSGGGGAKDGIGGAPGTEMPDDQINYLPFPRRMVPTYEVEVTCLGPGASNIKAPREVDAGSILRVKFFPEEGAALLSLTVNGQTYDPALLKVEGEALIYGINRIDEDYALVAEFGEPVLAGVPEVEVVDPPKTGDAAASGGFFMLLVLAFGVALWRARRGRASS